MPWNLEQRDGQWCVVKVGTSSPVPGGCHASRADAVKHQRALYANESRVASLYADLDARTPDYVPPAPEEPPQTLTIQFAQDKALTAAVATALERQDRTDQALSLVASAIQTMADKPTPEPPTITVEQPDIHVAAPEVTVQPPEVRVEVAAPEVTVRPEIILPAETSGRKEVVFERDPAGRITGATVEEN